MGFVLYVDNVRRALGNLSLKEKTELAIKVKEILLREGKIKSAVRPSEIERYIDNFIKGKETSIKYFEGILNGLDSLYTDGAKTALFEHKIRELKTWRDLLIKLTTDLPSRKLSKYDSNEAILTEIKRLFVTITEACVTDDEASTMLRLQVLNDLLKSK